MCKLLPVAQLGSDGRIDTESRPTILHVGGAFLKLSGIELQCNPLEVNSPNVDSCLKQHLTVVPFFSYLFK